MFTVNYKSVACLSLALSLSGCVATRKHVKSVSDPLDRRIGGLESKTREQDTTLANHDKAIAAADERAKAADQHASEVEKQAKANQERIGQVSEQTTAAKNAAAEAKTVADQGVAKATSVEREMQTRFGSLDNYQLATTQSVLFGFSKSSLTPEATKQLDDAAAEALKHTRYVIEVQGFTDQTGSTESNLVLSRQRADEVVRYLTMQHKIPLYRIYQLGAGEAVPVGDDKTREGRKQNRRVEVRVFSADSDGKKVTASANGGQ
jgi:outer membrane protein OmpA-like peptidoglycan-associated protein